MKFLVDMPLPPGLADWLRAAGHDAVHAIAIEMGRATDADIIATAGRELRVVKKSRSRRHFDAGDNNARRN